MRSVNFSVKKAQDGQWTDGRLGVWKLRSGSDREWGSRDLMRGRGCLLEQCQDRWMGEGTLVELDWLSGCFSPVLRTLARLKPTMTLEEGLPRAVQEWGRTSNFDRMIFYEMAEKWVWRTLILLTGAVWLRGLGAGKRGFSLGMWVIIKRDVRRRGVDLDRVSWIIATLPPPWLLSFSVLPPLGSSLFSRSCIT